MSFNSTLDQDLIYDFGTIVMEVAMNHTQLKIGDGEKLDKNDQKELNKNIERALDELLTHEQADMMVIIPDNRGREFSRLHTRQEIGNSVRKRLGLDKMDYLVI